MGRLTAPTCCCGSETTAEAAPAKSATPTPTAEWTRRTWPFGAITSAQSVNQEQASQKCQVWHSRSASRSRLWRRDRPLLMPPGAAAQRRHDLVGSKRVSVIAMRFRVTHLLLMTALVALVAAAAA